MLSKITSGLPALANAIAAAGAPQGEGSVDTGGLDSAAFLSLHMCAIGGDLHDLLPAYDPIAKDSEEGPWVFAIPSRLRDHLALLSPAAIRDLALAWAECEELQEDEVGADEALEILVGISELARTTSSTGSELIMWLSQ